MEKMSVSRRSFMVGAGAMAAMQGISLAQNAPKTFKYALVGCGGRGTGAAANIEEAARNLGMVAKMVGAADFFEDKAKAVCKAHGCDEKFAFGGGDGYKKLLEGDADIVLLCTPPIFRPLHAEAVIAAGKHLFAEKPIAVDPPGIRRFLKAVEAAKQRKQMILSGTCHRPNWRALQLIKPVRDGVIGEILGGVVYRCHGAIWERPRRPTDTNAGYLANNWYNFREMCGDNLTEQAIHEVDLANWFVGRYPERAMGIGARYRKSTGNGYNCLSVDYDYGKNLHIHAIARQVNGCWDRCCAMLTGTKGQIDVLGSKIVLADGTSKPFPFDTEAIKGINQNMMVNEHMDLLKALNSGTYMNEGDFEAMSTATTVMGTLATYTGQMVRMSDLLTNEKSPIYNWKWPVQPEDFERGEDIKLPGENEWMVPGQ
ncbi:MAG: Gfo/Idh/MocA family oxidoreductase [Kiritimatiellae bacterium]|nr:Gfo/Idh/MocA family oxidoreductase [Kiritimatiellia bacterium]